MKKVMVEVKTRGIVPDTVVVDGGGIGLWRGIGDLVSGAEQYINWILDASDVYATFDHYFERSIKLDTSLDRIGVFHRSHQLSIQAELLPKNMCKSSTKKKKRKFDWNHH